MNKKEKLEEAIVKALQENINDINLTDYKDILDKLLYLTMPRTKLKYRYEILDDEIILYCESGIDSSYDTQAINSLEGWCSRFAKKISNYDKFFSDNRDIDWYSGMTFGKTYYRTIDYFYFNIFLDIDNKSDAAELDNILRSYTSNELDMQIKQNDNKYNNSKITKLSNILKNVGFTEDQIRICIDLKLYDVNGVFADIKRLSKNDEYKNIPLDVMKSIIAEYIDYSYSDYMKNVFKITLEGIKFLGVDTVIKLYKENNVYSAINKIKEIYKQNVQQEADRNQPDLVKWAKQTISNVDLPDVDPYDLIKAINNGYSKDVIETVINYYKDNPNFKGFKSKSIRQNLLDVLAGKYDLNKSQIEYLLNICKDYNNIKYPETLLEIIKALENGLSVNSINDILSQYSTTKDIRKELNKLLHNK